MKIKLLCLSLLSATLITSCGEKATVSLNTKQIELTSGETFKLEYSNSGFGELPVYTSEDEYFATVDSTGLVTANYVGVTTIIAKVQGTTLEAGVEINPVYTLYDKPFIEFGSSKGKVRRNESRTFLSEINNANGIDNLVYADETASSIQYLFDKGKLYASNVILDRELDAIRNFLNERYIFIEDIEGTNGTPISIWNKKSNETEFIIGVQPYDDIYIISYLDPEYEASTKTITNQTNVLAEIATQLKK